MEGAEALGQQWQAEAETSARWEARGLRGGWRLRRRLSEPPPPSPSPSPSQETQEEARLVEVTIAVTTSGLPLAESATGALISFQVARGVWSEEQTLCYMAGRSEVVSLRCTLPSWPSRLRVRALYPEHAGIAATAASAEPADNDVDLLPEQLQLHGVSAATAGSADVLMADPWGVSRITVMNQDTGQRVEVPLQGGDEVQPESQWPRWLWTAALEEDFTVPSLKNPRWLPAGWGDCCCASTSSSSATTNLADRTRCQPGTRSRAVRCSLGPASACSGHVGAGPRPADVGFCPKDSCSNAEGTVRADQVSSGICPLGGPRADCELQTLILSVVLVVLGTFLVLLAFALCWRRNQQCLQPAAKKGAAIGAERGEARVQLGPKAEADLLSGFLGCWQCGKGTAYFISVATSDVQLTPALRFDERLPSWHWASAGLEWQKEGDGWLQGRVMLTRSSDPPSACLAESSGTLCGLLRLRRHSCNVLLSNFRAPGASSWGQDVLGYRGGSIVTFVKMPVSLEPVCMHLGMGIACDEVSTIAPNSARGRGTQEEEAAGAGSTHEELMEAEELEETLGQSQRIPAYVATAALSCQRLSTTSASTSASSSAPSGSSSSSSRFSAFPSAEEMRRCPVTSI